MAEGFGLVIPDNLLSQLQEVDTKVAKIAETSKNTASIFTNSFSQMAQAGANPLADALDKIISKQSKIGNITSSFDNVGKSMGQSADNAKSLSTSIAQAADNINKMNNSGDGGNKNIEKLKSQLLDIDKEFKLLRDSEKAFDDNGKLTTTARALSAKRNAISEEISLYSMSVDKIEAFEDRKARAAENAAKRAAKASELEQKAKLSTYSGSMSYASNAVSINDRAQATKYLTAARNAENTTTTEGTARVAELNAKIKEMNSLNKQSIAGSKELASTHRSLMDTTSQLARKFALLFSVSAITGYMSKLVDVRGMFELQQVSLGAILQNKQQADEIFNKTVSLAVNSPFRIKELITYTKELAAYRVESGKLYDTTKMLADVSAGLGVDMDRLILAYGQVKAASFLRGQEVRQFTEAGINLYGELAKYYEDVKGRAYSTGQIVDMISKRMVSFSDVEQVFKRLTSQGGIFYNMQEIQANTLQGKIANLKDSVDIMLNDIGKSNQDFMKGTIDVAKGILDNWKAIVNVGQALAAVLLLLKLRSVELGVSFTKYITTAELANSATKGVTAMNFLSLGFKNVVTSIKTFGLALKGAFLSNIYLVAIMATVSAIYELYKAHEEYIAELKKIDDETDKAQAKITNLSIEFDKLSESSKKVKIGEIETEDDATIESKKAKIKELIDLYKNEGIEVPVKIGDLNKDNVDKTFEYLKQKYIEFVNFSADVSRAIAENNARLSMGGLFGENINDDMKDLSSSIVEVRAHASDMQAALYKVGANYGSLTDEAKKYYDSVKDGKKDNETQLQYLQRLDAALHLITRTSATIGEGGYVVGWAREVNTTLSSFFVDWNNYEAQLKEGQQEWMKVIDRLKSEYPNWATMPKWTLKVAIDKAYNATQWDNAAKDAAKTFAYTKFKIKPTVDGKAVDDSISFIDKAFNDFFSKKHYNVKVDVLTSGGPLSNLNSKLSEGSKNLKELEKQLKQVQKAPLQLFPTDSGSMQPGWVLVKQIKGQIAAIRAAKNNYNYEDSEDVKREKKNQRDRVNHEREYAKDRKTIFDNQLSTLKDINSEYSKYLEFEGEDAAKKDVLSRFASTLKAVKMPANIMDGILPTKEGILAATEKIKPPVKELKKLLDFQRELKLEIYTEAAEKKAKDFKDKVQKELDSLKLNHELLGLGLTQTEIDTMFNGLTKNLSDVENELSKIDRSKLGKKELEAVKDTEKEISKMKVDEAFKTFKYLVKTYKNTMSSQLEIDIWYADERNKILSNPNLKSATGKAEQQTMLANLDKMMQQKTSENAFNQFKGSDMYVTLFDNMEYASTKSLERIKAKLEELKDSFKTLSPEKLKVVTEEYNKLTEELNKRSPFKAFIDDYKKIQELKKQGLTEDVLDQQLVQYNAQADALQQQIDDIGALTNIKEKGLSLDNLSIDAQKRLGGLVNESLPALNKISKIKKDALSKTKLDINATTGYIDSYNKVRASYKAMASSMQNILQLSNSMVGSLKTIYEALGGEADDTTEVFLDITSSLANSIVQAMLFGLQLQILTAEATAMGVAINAALGPIGWIAIGLSAVASVLSSIFGNHDKKKQKEIESLQKQVQQLQRAYTNLKDAMDKAYDTTSLIEYRKEMEKNLDTQVANYQAMIAAEKEKKHTDEGKIQEWQNAIDDISKSRKELEDSVLQDLGGIGDKVKSTAEEFVDAWVDAFYETGSGLDALGSKFDDLFKNALKKQLTYQVTSKYLAPLFKQLDSYFGATSEGAEKLTPNEMKAWQSAASIAKTGVNDYLSSTMQMLKDMGIDLSTSSSELNGLQQGIQNITEAQASSIESMLNSLRFFVSQQTSDISAIRSLLANYIGYSSPQSGGDSNTLVLNELKAQTALINSINNSFISVIKQGHSMGGAGIKVFM